MTLSVSLPNHVITRTGQMHPKKSISPTLEPGCRSDGKRSEYTRESQEIVSGHLVLILWTIIVSNIGLILINLGPDRSSFNIDNGFTLV